MRIYLAARYGRADELRGYRDTLRELGHKVDCRWLEGDHRIADETLNQPDVPNTEGIKFAIEDYVDVLNCDLLLMFSEIPRSGHSRGGRHVEFGLALAWSKLTTVIGPRENVFHYLPKVCTMPSFDTWLEAVHKAGGANRFYGGKD